MIVLLTEDRCSGKDFWEQVIALRWNSITVVSKKNAYELVKYINKVKDNKGDIFLVALDRVADNENVMQNYNKVVSFIKERANFVILDLVCVEYLLLSFEKLQDYLSMQQGDKIDNFLYCVRQNFLDALSLDSTYPINSLDSVIKYKDKYHKIGDYTVETLSSSLLERITKNTGYSFDKSFIGDCWFKSCCVSQYGDCCRSDSDLYKLNEFIQYSLFRDISLILDRYIKEGN